ncbi:hypothetical protein FACS1894187_14320 [Synergistales bacterium]|nr:hypothetical protein FACS1894187_14320 [Synergistales bacterium]
MNDSNTISAQWLFIPPVVGVVTFMAVITFASGAVVSVHSSIWGLTGLLFMTMTILYVLFMNRGFDKGLLPTQVIAQGLLICPLALRVGASFVEWLGVTMVICGSAVLLIFYHHARHYGGYALGKSNENKSPNNLSDDIDSLPLPVAFADSEGDVLTVSDVFLQITGLSRRDVLGYPVTVLTPIDREIVRIKGKEWKLLQTALPSDKYCFCLEEIITAATPQVAIAGDLVDPETTLFAAPVAARRTNKELYRVSRYKRSISAALIRIIFDDTDSPEAQKEVFNEYCRYIKKSVRESDTASAVNSRDIYLLLPETKLEGANMVTSKLVDITTSPEMREAFLKLTTLPKFLDKALFFGPPANDISFNDILSRLTSSLSAPQ